MLKRFCYFSKFQNLDWSLVQTDLALHDNIVRLTMESSSSRIKIDEAEPEVSSFLCCTFFLLPAMQLDYPLEIWLCFAKSG